MIYLIQVTERQIGIYRGLRNNPEPFFLAVYQTLSKIYRQSKPARRCGTYVIFVIRGAEFESNILTDSAFKLVHVIAHQKNIDDMDKLIVIGFMGQIFYIKH